MTAVAGDIYDFVQLGPSSLGILVADVSGHGIPAALVASMVKVDLSPGGSCGRSGQSPRLHESDPLSPSRTCICDGCVRGCEHRSADHHHRECRASAGSASQTRRDLARRTDSWSGVGSFPSGVHQTEVAPSPPANRPCSIRMASGGTRSRGQFSTATASPWLRHEHTWQKEPRRIGRADAMDRRRISTRRDVVIRRTAHANSRRSRDQELFLIVEKASGLLAQKNRVRRYDILWHAGRAPQGSVSCHQCVGDVDAP